MKKRRRIEIMTFRCRRTLILQDKPASEPVDPHRLQVDASHGPSDSPPAEVSELNQPQATQLPPGSLVFNQS